MEESRTTSKRPRSPADSHAMPDALATLARTAHAAQQAEQLKHMMTSAASSAASSAPSAPPTSQVGFFPVYPPMPPNMVSRTPMYFLPQQNRPPMMGPPGQMMYPIMNFPYFPQVAPRPSPPTNADSPSAEANTLVPDEGELADEIRRAPARIRTVKAEPDIVAWLQENYEPKAGYSLPRSLVYDHYAIHARANSQDPSNPAGFGKLIRSVFPTVTSRRLGSRGQSRYHYDGLRVKQSSALAKLPDVTREVKIDADKIEFPANGAENVVSYAPNEAADDDGAGALASLSASVDHGLALPPFEDMTREDCVISGNESVAVPAAVEARETAFLKAFTVRYHHHASGLLDAIQALDPALVATQLTHFWVTEFPEQLRMLLAQAGACHRMESWDASVVLAAVHALVPNPLAVLGKGERAALRKFGEDVRAAIATIFGPRLEAARPNAPQWPPNLIESKKRAGDKLCFAISKMILLNSLAGYIERLLSDASTVERMAACVKAVDFPLVEQLVLENSPTSGPLLASLSELVAALTAGMPARDEPPLIGRVELWVFSLVQKTILGHTTAESSAKDQGASFIRELTFVLSKFVIVALSSEKREFGLHSLKDFVLEYAAYIVEVGTSLPSKVATPPVRAPAKQQHTAPPAESSKGSASAHSDGEEDYDDDDDDDDE